MLTIDYSLFPFLSHLELGGSVENRKGEMPFRDERNIICIRKSSLIRVSQSPHHSPLLFFLDSYWYLLMNVILQLACWCWRLSASYLLWLLGVSSLVFSIRTYMAVYSSNFVLPQILVNLDGEEGHELNFSLITCLLGNMLKRWH